MEPVNLGAICTIASTGRPPTNLHNPKLMDYKLNLNGETCAWTTELPCAAQMFEACAELWGTATGAGPDKRRPVCFRGRSKGAKGETLVIAGKLAAEAARIAAAGVETTAVEQALLNDAYLLGWDEVTWPQAAAHVRNLAAWLRSNGVKRGDRVCLFADAGGDCERPLSPFPLAVSANCMSIVSIFY